MLLAATLAIALSGPVSAASGKKIFNKCKACHSLEQGKNKIGPSLYSLFGNEAGTVNNYRYSVALKASGIVWNEDTLTEWLRNSSKMVRGTKMRFKLKEKYIAPLVEFLFNK